MSRAKRQKSAYGYVILSLDDYAGTPIPHYNTLTEAQKDFKDWGCECAGNNTICFSCEERFRC